MTRKPNAEFFRKVVHAKGGNISKVAEALNVTRATVYNWMRDDVDFREAVNDERGSLFDACLVSARLLAVGIPSVDDEGKFTGWIERPDPSMLRYLMSTLGRKDGFGECDAAAEDVSCGVPIERWIRENDKDAKGV